MTAHRFQGRADPAGRPAFRIEKAFWGYVIRSADGPPLLLQVAQGFVLALGASFTAAALVLVVPLEAATTGAGSARAGLALVLASMALLLVRFATRGGVVELQLDLVRGELREIVRHRIGRASLIGRHDFGPGATLAVDRSGPPSAPCSLILRLRGDGGGLCIAQGPEPAILELRRRLDPGLRGQGALGSWEGRLAA